jgi:hypothetical protein
VQALLVLAGEACTPAVSRFHTRCIDTYVFRKTALLITALFSNRVLIPENVIYFYHEEREGLEDITVLTSRVIL